MLFSLKILKNALIPFITLHIEVEKKNRETYNQFPKHYPQNQNI